VKEAIVQASQVYGIDTSFPFKLKRATKHFEEDARYNMGLSNRVGQEVGVGVSKDSKFWKPKKKPSSSSSSSQDNYASSYWSSRNNYSSYNVSYSSSSSSSSSFDDDNHVNLVMLWSSGVKEHQLFSNHNSDNNDNDDNTKENMMTLEDCLNLFAVTEKLSQEDSWYCPKCKEFKEATKKMDIWTTPPILCIHLKRFSVDVSSFWVDKLETPIRFPINEKLDMSKHCLKPSDQNDNENKSNYSLLGVSNHFGGTGGGHYTAYTRKVENGKWYYCDDSSINEVIPSSNNNEIELDGSAAYVLFYLRDDYVPSSWSNNESQNIKHD
jgi:hypothetical protein